MPQDNSGLAQKRFKSFWPLAIIFVVAALAAGFIYMFQFSLNLDYDLQSIVISVHRRTEAPKVPAKTVKTPVKSVTTSTTPATKK